MGNGEVYDRFVLNLVYLILTLFFDFVLLFPYWKQPLLPHHTRCNLEYYIKVVLISATKLKMKRRANCFHENL